MKKIKENRGLVKAILVIVIALVILGYFGYNLRDIVNSPSVRDNVTYVWELLTKAWDFVKNLFNR